MLSLKSIYLSYYIHYQWSKFIGNLFKMWKRTASSAINPFGEPTRKENKYTFTHTHMQQINPEVDLCLPCHSRALLHFIVPYAKLVNWHVFFSSYFEHVTNYIIIIVINLIGELQSFLTISVRRGNYLCSINES